MPFRIRWKRSVGEESDRGGDRSQTSRGRAHCHITKMKEQLEKVTSDSIKKSTKIEELRRQRMMLRNKVEELTALETAVEERDFELDSVRALFDILKQGRDERERLRLRYNELGLSLATVQEKLEEARTQISILIEDLSLRRQELDSLRRQLEASTIGCPAKTSGLRRSSETFFSTTCCTC